jgi:hypothetical protein
MQSVSCILIMLSAVPPLELARVKKILHSSIAVLLLIFSQKGRITLVDVT